MTKERQLHLYIVGVVADDRARADVILAKKLDSRPKAQVYYASGGGDFTVLFRPGDTFDMQGAVPPRPDFIDEWDMEP